MYVRGSVFVCEQGDGLVYMHVGCVAGVQESVNMCVICRVVWAVKCVRARERVCMYCMHACMHSFMRAHVSMHVCVFVSASVSVLSFKAWVSGAISRPM